MRKDVIQREGADRTGIALSAMQRGGAHVGNLPRVQRILFNAGARDHLAVHKKAAIDCALIIYSLPVGLVERALTAQRQMRAKDGVLPDRQRADGGVRRGAFSGSAGVILISN